MSEVIEGGCASNGLRKGVKGGFSEGKGEGGQKANGWGKLVADEGDQGISAEGQGKAWHFP